MFIILCKSVSIVQPCNIVCGGEEDVDDELADAGHHGHHDQGEALSEVRIIRYEFSLTISNTSHSSNS